MKRFSTLIVGLAATLFSVTASATPTLGCDTLTNLTSRDTLTLLFNSGGLVSGNNTFGDLEKAEQFRGPRGSQLTGAFIGFGYVSILPSDTSTTVTINAYSDTAGAPGATIATTTVTLGQIAAAVRSQTGLYVTFTSPPTLTSQTFYISVVLPATAGDTIAVLTNQFNSLDGQGWERWSDSAWHAYPPTYGSLPNLFGYDIQAVTCGGGPLAAFQSSLLTTLCVSSQQIDFYNTSSNGVDSIRWSFPGGTPSTSTAANPIVNYTAGLFNVPLVAYGSGQKDTTTATVYIAPPLTTSVSTTLASGPTDTNGTASVTILTGTPPYQYYWSDTNQDITPAVTGLAPGTYLVDIYDSSNCFIEDTVVISFSNGVISIGGNHAVRIYPAPATDVLNLVWDAATTADLSVTDMSGEVVGRYRVDNSTSRVLDISRLSAGTYILSIRDTLTRSVRSVRFTKL